MEVIFQAFNSGEQQFYCGSYLLITLILALFYIKMRQQGHKIVNKIDFHCLLSTFNANCIRNIEMHVGRYEPPWWYSPILGTLVAFGADPKLKYEREVFTDDHKTYAIDWFPHKPTVTSSPSITSSTSSSSEQRVLVFVPGLGLHSMNKFCQQFVRTMSAKGYIIVVVNARGVNMPLRSSRLWFPGLLDDVSEVLIHVNHLLPSAKIHLVGFSAGTNIVQKILLRQSQGDSSLPRVEAAMCVCACHDYLGARERLEGTWTGRIFSFLMALIYQDTIRQNDHVHAELGHEVVKKVLSARSISQYDRIAHCDLHGFSSEEDYASTMSVRCVRDIAVPLLLLQPDDDPLHQGQFEKNVDVDKVTKNGNIIIMRTTYGNHFGFYEGGLLEAFTNRTSYTYPANVAIEFFMNVSEADKMTENTVATTTAAAGGAAGGGGSATNTTATCDGAATAATTYTPTRTRIGSQ